MGATASTAGSFCSLAICSAVSSAEKPLSAVANCFLIVTPYLAAMSACFVASRASHRSTFFACASKDLPGAGVVAT